MTPNPFLNQVRRRIAATGGWSRLCLFPREKQRVKPSQRVFLLSREDRRFVVVAKNFLEADNRLTATLATDV
jgi:hypothetical protein